MILIRSGVIPKLNRTHSSKITPTATALNSSTIALSHVSITQKSNTEFINKERKSVK
mgnify:FL=1